MGERGRSRVEQSQNHAPPDEAVIRQYADMVYRLAYAQTHSSRDAQAWLRLRDAAGNTVEATQKYSFAHNAGGADRVDYEEYIFDLPQGTVDGYTLYGDFSIAGLHTEGNWQVTFRLPE